MNSSHTLTLGQAAKEVGCSKATLSKALKNGALSAEKREDGSYCIQPAELMRWNGNRSTMNTKNHPETSEKSVQTPAGTLDLLTENATLRAKLALMEETRGQERHDLLEQVTDLRARLDRSEDERREQAQTLRLLLPAPEPAATTPEKPRGWLQRLFG